MTDLGAFTGDGRLRRGTAHDVVLDLPDRLPARRPAAAPLVGDRAPGLPYAGRSTRRSASTLPTPAAPVGASEHRLEGSGHPFYDHEVQGGTVVKPLTGARDDGPSDACVLKPAGTRGARGLVLSNGINAEFGKHGPLPHGGQRGGRGHPQRGGGGRRPRAGIALLDNFCWGDPQRPETLGSLVEAARGCHDAALRYGAPFISGKDSLNNEYRGPDGRRHAIPPTLLISAHGPHRRRRARP